MLQFRDRSYAAFLFDMDGTLLDSSAAVDRTWRVWAGRHGVDADELIARAHGVRSEDTIRQYAEQGLKVDVAKETAWFLEAEIADVDGIVPIPGIQKFLKPLDPARWAVVTSASRDLAVVRLKAAGLPTPAVFVTAEDVRRGKPDPEGYLTAAKLLGMPIGQCLVFEDSTAGVAAAQAAGADVVIVGGLVPPSRGTFAIRDYR